MKNEKNRLPKGLDEWKTEKIARPRGWKSSQRYFLFFQGLGNAAFEIFYSSQVWESIFSPFFGLPNVWTAIFFHFFILPKFGKSDFPHFLVFPILGKYLPLIFGFPSRGKSVFRCFLLFPRGGNPFFAACFFSPVRESCF